ncbi:MAG TPA: TOPRIM nucleotidyl transferase/hydrolase domain-containing protein [Drouetiella sp.]
MKDKRAHVLGWLHRFRHLKIDNKINLAPNNLAQLTADEVLSVVQKLLFFDEPSSRCARLKKVVAKQLKASAVKESELNALSQQQQDVLFDAVFGARPNQPVDRLLSVLIGLEDITRFDEIAFDSWAHEAGNSKSQLSDVADATDSSFWNALKRWLEAANLSNSQIEWLIHCAIATPAWHVLNDETNSLSAFLQTAHRQLMSSYSERETFEERDFSLAHAKFTKLLHEFRALLPTEFLPQAVVIVEGPTEELLLPKFAQTLGTDLKSFAVMIVSAGGAKQVARHYLLLRDIAAVPIVCLLDKDAEEQATIISDSIRDCDKLFVLQSGEIEDTFEASAFARYLNLYLETMPGSLQSVSAKDFPTGVARKSLLAKLWKSRKLGDFDKIDFAETIAKNIRTASDVPAEFHAVLKFLVEVAAEHV